MPSLHDLYDQQGQSPWLDNLRRDWIENGELQRWIDRGVRGITSNPSIFQKAIGGSDDYDRQFAELLAAGKSVEESYWGLVTTDIENAVGLLRPIYDASSGEDGYVSVEVDPGLARDTVGTIDAARALHERIDQPNLYVKIPGTAEGVAAIQEMISENRSINVTLLFSVSRYAQIIEAYLAGLEANTADDLSRVSSVASFFISRVDAEVDQRLAAIGTDEANGLMGRAAVANGKLAYQLFREAFSGPRWNALRARGARVQRPLWASTSTKNPDYPNTLYVDTLIGPDTVNTLPDATIAAFENEGTIARTVDAGVSEAQATVDHLNALGIDLEEVAVGLEDAGVQSFQAAFDDLLATLKAKADLV